MTRDDIIRLGRESQRERFSDGGHWFSMEVKDLERFAALVTAETGKENERLREENERLRADAERYRWVCDHALAIDLAADPDNFVQVWVGTDPARVFRGKTLDDAIDEAMKQAALRREEDQT